MSPNTRWAVTGCSGIRVPRGTPPPPWFLEPPEPPLPWFPEQCKEQQCKAKRSNAKHCKALQSNAKQCKTMQIHSGAFPFSLLTMRFLPFSLSPPPPILLSNFSRCYRYFVQYTFRKSHFCYIYTHIHIYISKCECCMYIYQMFKICKMLIFTLI